MAKSWYYRLLECGNEVLTGSKGIWASRKAAGAQRTAGKDLGIAQSRQGAENSREKRIRKLIGDRRGGFTPKKLNELIFSDVYPPLQLCSRTAALACVGSPMRNLYRQKAGSRNAAFQAQGSKLQMSWGTAALGARGDG